ncbi:helix-turn-helix domain-containing protein [Actinomadura sp. 21ATH]|uniref:helix-turn-helix domain-containing protein n=1 Tax=Actinomadura sp. 21ATH TaxID=1735444 RepID=UPI0035C00486
MVPVSPSALSPTCHPSPVLWLWPGQAIYAGPALGLGPHAGSVACLAVGLDAPFRVRAGDGAVCVRARTALIAPRVRHLLTAEGDRMLFCYLDPASARRSACEQRMTGGRAPVLTGHRDEHALLTLAADLHLASGARRWLDRAAPDAPAGPDQRIRAVTALLLDETHRTVMAAEGAAICGLSLSRFLHLFKTHTGTSFRRYRLWARMIAAGRTISAGGDLTRAAAEAGFATPSHFSAAFHRMFGLQPGRLLATGLTIADASETPLPKERP